jgi:hypothetical protein
MDVIIENMFVLRKIRKQLFVTKFWFQYYIEKLRLNKLIICLFSAVCDTGTYGGPKVPKSTQNWYCEACDLELTSEVVYDSHIKGSKHAKKVFLN